MSNEHNSKPACQIGIIFPEEKTVYRLFPDNDLAFYIGNIINAVIFNKVNVPVIVANNEHFNFRTKSNAGNISIG